MQTKYFKLIDWESAFCEEEKTSKFIGGTIMLSNEKMLIQSKGGYKISIYYNQIDKKSIYCNKDTKSVEWIKTQHTGEFDDFYFASEEKAIEFTEDLQIFKESSYQEFLTQTKIK